MIVDRAPEATRPQVPPTPMARVAAWLMAAVAFGYAASTTLAIFATGLREPFFDQYRQYVSLIERPLLQALVALDNGHRPVLPNLVRWLDLHLLHGSQWLATTLGAACALLVVGLVGGAVRRSAGFDAPARAAVVLLACVAVFWLGNARMLLQGSEAINVHFIVLALVGASLLLHRAAVSTSARPVVMATLLAFVATFTFGPGIAAFPALIVLAVVLRIPPARALPLVGGALLAFALYVFVLPGDEGVRGSMRFAPLENLRWASQWLAAPLVYGGLGWGSELLPAWLGENARTLPPGNAVALVAGALGGALPPAGPGLSSSLLLGFAGAAGVGLHTVQRLLRGAPRATPIEAVALALALFGGACAVVIAINRAALFEAIPGQVFADRYLPWTSLFWFGASVLLLCRFGRRRAPLAAALALLVAAVAWPTHAVQAAWGASVFHAAERFAVGVAAGSFDPQFLPHPDEATPQDIARTAGLLRERRWAMFRDAAWRAPGERIVVDDGAAAGPIRAVVGSAYSDPITGQAMLRIELATDRATARRHPGHLPIVDAHGVVVGAARLATAPRTVVGNLVLRRLVRGDGYARGSPACAALRVVAPAPSGAAAQVLARFDGCVAAPPAPGVR